MYVCMYVVYIYIYKSYIKRKTVCIVENTKKTFHQLLFILTNYT